MITNSVGVRVDCFFFCRMKDYISACRLCLLAEDLALTEH